MNDHAPLNEGIAKRYIADPELQIAAEVAMELGQPLLLTGEPGTGKTTFAEYLAERLAPEWLGRRLPAQRIGPLPLYSFETKSSSVATDLFYRFDNLRRFQASYDAKMSRDARDYISFEALGLAILGSRSWADVADLVPDEADHLGPERAVVLIDEIDKAPRDFPNDLLNEIKGMFFRIPEVQTPGGRGIRKIEADPKYRPIVVLTSNSEKNLPAPFLRRCVFHHIRFPERKMAARLRDIVCANLGQAAGTLVNDALEFFYDTREQLALDKKPTTAELVQWVDVLQRRTWTGLQGHPGNTHLDQLPLEPLKATLGVLAKTGDDLDKVAALVTGRRTRP